MRMSALIVAMVSLNACAPRMTTPRPTDERLTLTAQLGARAPLGDPQHHEELAADGWARAGHDGLVPVVMVGARTQLDPVFAGELLLTRDLAAAVDRYERGADVRMRVDDAETTGTLLITWMYGPLRWGVGGGLRLHRTEAAYGLCECNIDRGDLTPALGAAFNVNYSLPITARMFADLRVQARWWVERNARIGPNGSPLYSGGPALLIGVGGGWRKGR